MTDLLITKTQNERNQLNKQSLISTSWCSTMNNFSKNLEFYFKFPSVNRTTKLVLFHVCVCCCWLDRNTEPSDAFSDVTCDAAETAAVSGVGCKIPFAPAYTTTLPILHTHSVTQSHTVTQTFTNIHRHKHLLCPIWILQYRKIYTIEIQTSS